MAEVARFDHYEAQRQTGYVTLDLTPEQERLWIETKGRIYVEAPAFSHLFYTMMNPAKTGYIATFVTHLSDGRPLPVAATDGVTMLLNPEPFFALPIRKRVFVLCHEILHCVLDHIGTQWRYHKAKVVRFQDGTQLPYDDATMDVACDYVINAMLVEAKIGELDANWYYDPKIATHAETSVSAYRKIYKPPPPSDGDRAGHPPPPPKPDPKRFDAHLPPGGGSNKGEDPDKVQARRNDTEWKTQLAAGMAAADRAGKKMGGLRRVFQDLLEPQVTWSEYVQAFFARNVGSGAYSWRRPNRQLLARGFVHRSWEAVIAPGRVGTGCGAVAVAADTSGSIGSRTLDMFFAEVGGILEELKPEILFLLWCDASVHNADEVEDVTDLQVIRHKGVKGGGGTSFVPVFTWLEERAVKLDALVYLTDGEGRFPRHAPDYPVLWGSIKRGPEHYPFGDVVMIPKQMERR
jgi:predicted metal-dependent peptidase